MNIEFESFLTACMKEMSSRIEKGKIRNEEVERISFILYKSFWLKRILKEHEDASNRLFSDYWWKKKKQTINDSQNQAVNK